MTHCAKCGAELIGTRKFCTACGTPAGDPRSPAASTGMSPVSPGSAPISSGPSLQYASPAPVSQVNPFAQTAGPAKSPPASDYGPPPSVPLELASTLPGGGDPSRGPQVSPLAISNVNSGGGAFHEVIAAASHAPSAGSMRAAVPESSPGGSGIKRGVPGTQLMPSQANPSVGPNASPSGAPSAAGQPSTPGQPRPERTQLLGVLPGVPASSAPSPSAPRVGPGRDSSNPDPGSYGSSPPPPGHPPQTAPLQPALAAPSPQVVAPPPPPVAQHRGPGVPLPSPHQGWIPTPHASAAPAYAPPVPPAPPPGYGYGFAYAPGSRVTVTWSNGQRYPGTVTQVTGSQCLVVFPDGQHHWVELQYVAPT